jgi:AcrR family transcriptional regulator
VDRRLGSTVATEQLRGTTPRPSTPRRPPHERRKQSTRAHGQQGRIPAVGIREIARQLELSPGNVSYHFPTKEALVAALIEEGHAENNALVAAPMGRLDSGGVDRIIRAIMRRDLENQWLMRDGRRALFRSFGSSSSPRCSSGCPPRSSPHPTATRPNASTATRALPWRSSWRTARPPADGSSKPNSNRVRNMGPIRDGRREPIGARRSFPRRTGGRRRGEA